MEERDVTTEEIKRQIRRRVADIYGQDCAVKNQGEIETLAGMVERVRRMDAPTLESLKGDPLQ